LPSTRSQMGQSSRGASAAKTQFWCGADRTISRSGPSCTHYHAPLADGLIVDDTIRCPMHHACFSLRTGEALNAPALDPIATWRVEVALGKAYVREKLDPPKPPTTSPGVASTKAPALHSHRWGRAAGLAAADMLRREGYSGPVTMVSADDVAPYDRPNVSKDFLAGTAPEEWMPLREAEYYVARQIDLVLNEQVSAIDATRRVVRLASSREIDYGALLLATGADPIRICPFPRRPARASSIFAPWPMLAPLSRRRAGTKRRLWWERASSDSRLPPRCARVASRCTSWDSSEYRWSACWARRSARSCATSRIPRCHVPSGKFGKPR
jgi:nitrite reductase/ring-hydroxylating ferredoxin subunit